MYICLNREKNDREKRKILEKNSYCFYEKSKKLSFELSRILVIFMFIVWFLMILNILTQNKKCYHKCLGCEICPLL